MTLTAATAAAMVGLVAPADGRAAAAYASASGGGSATVSCLEVKSRCVHRKGCLTALRNVLDECLVPAAAAVAAGGGNGARLAASAAAAVGRCPERCKWALMSLVSVEDDIGRDYLTCDCARSEACLQIKSNISACADDVQRAAERLTDQADPAPGGGGGESAPAVSCHLAWMLCQADTSCSTALVFYERFCADPWRFSAATNTIVAAAAEDDADDAGASLRCTRRCSNSVFVLYRQAKASRLKRCYCDDGDATCARIRGNTARLCPHNSADAWSSTLRLSQTQAAAAAPRSARTTERPVAAAASDGLHSYEPTGSPPRTAPDARDAAAGAASAAGAQAPPLNISLGALLSLCVAWLVHLSSLTYKHPESASASGLCIL